MQIPRDRCDPRTLVFGFYPRFLFWYWCCVLGAGAGRIMRQLSRLAISPAGECIRRDDSDDTLSKQSQEQSKFILLAVAQIRNLWQKAAKYSAGSGSVFSGRLNLLQLLSATRTPSPYVHIYTYSCCWLRPQIQNGRCLALLRSLGGKCEQLVDPSKSTVGYLALQPGLIKNKLANMPDNENSWPCLSRPISGNGRGGRRYSSSVERGWIQSLSPRTPATVRASQLTIQSWNTEMIFKRKYIFWLLSTWCPLFFN